MSPNRLSFGPQRPWYARGARRRGAVVATATVLVLFGFASISPASAEEIPPATTAPTETTQATAEATEPPPSDPATEQPAPTEPTEPAPTEPAPEPPPPTTDPPEPPPPTPDPTTPPPTTDPTTPPPTPPPPTTDPPPPPPTTPPPTTDPTNPPPTTDPTTPPPTAGPTTPPSTPRDFGSGPVVRVSTTTTADATKAAALLAARAKIDRATAELREAESALADARSMRVVARDVATQLQATADEAQLDADAAGRVYFAAARGDGTTVSSMDAVFGAGNDLLAGLGGVERVAQIAGDAEELIEIADERAEEAEAAQQRADAAWAAVDEVPVEAREDDVADAEREVSAARAALADLQARAANDSRLASSSVSLIASLPSDAGQLSDQGWARPVNGRITDGYGPRPDKPLAGVNDFHRGTDLAASCGAPIFAATGGVVVETGPNGSYGNWILIEHGSGVSTGYAHLIDGGIAVSAGDTVAAGQLIGAVGSTGASTGCHLHFEVRLDNVAVDAVPFMAARGIGLG